MMYLKNKFFVVTGGAQGIGKGIAKSIIDQGGKVLLVDKNKKLLEETSKLLNQSNETCIHKCIDLTDLKSFADAISFGHDLHGDIHGFCNGAALSSTSGPFETFTENDVNETIELTFTILWKSLTVEAKYLKKHKIPCSIVNISSNAAIYGHAYNSIYAASKSAVNNLTKSAAKELASFNIRINAISPGVIDTPGVRKYFKEQPKVEEHLLQSILLKRIGLPSDIGNAVTFLLSERAKYITGQIISVDGGSSIY